MMPKISVRPAASMNSSRPYCTLLSSWIRKFATSMGVTVGQSGQKKRWIAPPSFAAWSRLSGQLAAGAGGGQRLRGDADHHVVAFLHLAQVDILYRVVRLAHGPLAARAVDHGALDGLVQHRLVGEIPLDGVGAGNQQLARVVALHGVHVGLHLEL